MEAFDGSGALDESGVLFEFDDENIRRYDILGAIWGSSLRTSDLKSPSKESEGGEQKENKAAVVDNNSSGDNLSPENGSSSDNNSSAKGLSESVVDQTEHVPEAASLKNPDKSVPDNSGRLMDSNLAQNQEKRRRRNWNSTIWSRIKSGIRPISSQRTTRKSLTMM